MTARPPSLGPSLILSARCAPCIHAAFRQADDMLLPALCASDARGEFFALDCTLVQPLLIEVIHSRPHVVRGNHRHRRCSETLTVLNGVLDMYLLCDCPGRHLFCKRMESGASVHLPPGTAHAVHTLAETAITSVFVDGDPRLDRERVELISL
jgi:dTDP-4-dehydrorhamnose 3,5-epimerase-like enzyme